jgi:hypothetical protein
MASGGILPQDGEDAGEVLVHHGDVGVDEVTDESRGEVVTFDVDAGFVADFAVSVVESEVAEDQTVVGAGEVFGDIWVLLS